MSASQVGSYTIVRELGRGGMGVVSLARDSRLDRDVAIKALPKQLGDDLDRSARFEREAKLLAQLNHANIAGIYGLEEHDGEKFLVLEYVAGETLAARLARGPMPIDEAMEIAVQIASGLEAAHDAGVIHRDLKPGNLIVTPEGQVKILDFGLARAQDLSSGSSPSTSPDSPTITASPALHSPTMPGVVLGTAAYMSPEQARGRVVDKRADIWAFGVVLFEMLTGASMFAGDTVTDTLAGVLKGEINLSKLPGSTPPAIRRLLRRCLERNPKNRLHDIADARIVIDEVIAGDAQEFEDAPATMKRGRFVPWALAIVGVGAALVSLLTSGPEIQSHGGERLTRTSILAPIAAKADLRGGTFALSPDGSAVVLTASDEAGSRLYLRELDEAEPRPLAGTESAVYPFWSPDSRHIAFFATGALRRVPRDGGAVQWICAAKDGRGGAWNREGTILFAPDFQDVLHQVPASGGEPVAATTFDAAQGETSHRFPAFLADGRHFLFDGRTTTVRDRRVIKVASLDELSAGTRLLEASAVPRFASPNQLVFPRDAALMVQSIDLERFEMIGEARVLKERPSMLHLVQSAPIVEVSDTGKLLYAPIDPRPTAFVWLDRSGRRSTSGVQEEGVFSYPSVSHSGDRVVVTRTKTGNFSEGALWIFDLDHGDGWQVTGADQSAYSAIWSPDDASLAAIMIANREFLTFAPAWIAADSGEYRELLEPSKRWSMPTDVSTDGRILLYDDQVLGMLRNIGYLVLDEQLERTDYLATPAHESDARLSPDGRFVAYRSDVSGTFEAYIDTFPVPTRARRISTGGAALQVEFRSNGTELLILAADGDRTSLFTSALQTGDELEIGRPEKLFTLPVEWSGFAPAPNGDRFLLLEPVGDRSPSLTLVENWRAQLAPRR